MAGISSHVEHHPPGATRDWRHASAGGSNRHGEVCLAAAFVDLTGDSSEDEQTVKRFSATKQPLTTGKPQAAHRHSLGSLLCPSRGLGHSDDEDARSKGGAPPAVLLTPTRVVTQVPSRDIKGGPHGKRQAARAPKKAADAELARLKFACPGDKLKSPVGKRKRDQLGLSRVQLPVRVYHSDLVCK